MSRISLVPFCLVVALAVLGCSEMDDPSQRDLRSFGQVELAVDGMVEVIIIDYEISYAVEGTTAIQGELDVSGEESASLTLTLPASSFIIEVTAFDEFRQAIGTGRAAFDITPGELTVVNLVISINGNVARGDVAVDIGFERAPIIESTSVIPGAGGAELLVDATAPSGGELEILWGGYGVGPDPIVGPAVFVDESGVVLGAEYPMTIAAVQDLSNGTSTTVAFYPGDGCYTCGPVTTDIHEMSNNDCLAECKAQWDFDKKACNDAYPDDRAARWLCHTAAFTVYVDCIAGCAESF